MGGLRQNQIARIIEWNYLRGRLGNAANTIA
jgi:hypothetical protein